jgi:hypothetical protein
MEGQNLYVSSRVKDAFIKETSQLYKILSFAGLIKSFRKPHLAVCCACRQSYLQNYVDEIKEHFYI